jgi:hypothetical protein
MEGLDSGGQGPTSGCCAIEEEGYIMFYFINSDTVLKYLNKLQPFTLSLFTVNVKKGRTEVNIL